MNPNLILATLSNGKQISLADCRTMIANKDKAGLADFIYHRLYGRYLKPFDYPDEKYRKEYKNGFAIMASCCLLIETYVSFTDIRYRNTKGNSKKCFEHFFLTEPRFSSLATGNLPKDFYEDVRNGILHNAETRNGWMLTRDEKKPWVNTTTKEINATKFANRLKHVLADYRQKLIAADFDNDSIWSNFKGRLDDLIITS